MKFLDRLKLAVINRDVKELEKLSKEEPKYDSIKEANEILAFIVEANKILNEEKKDISEKMKEIKKLKKFYQENTSNSSIFKI